MSSKYSKEISKNQVSSFNNLMRDLSLDNENICRSNEDCCIYGDKNCKFSKKCINLKSKK